jgi:GTPase SAR1 family protein
MGFLNLFAKFFKPNLQLKLIILGLDNAGKTSILTVISGLII